MPFKFTEGVEAYLRRYLEHEDSLPFRQGDIFLDDAAKLIHVEPLALRFVKLLIEFEALQKAVAGIEAEQDNMTDNIMERVRNSGYFR